MGRQLVSTDFDALTWLQGWYAGKCDGKWEQERGITLASTDTPGWYLSIDLDGTPLETRPFKRIDHNRQADPSWWICQVGEGHFLAACAPRDLASVIAVFKDWAEG
jgi:hypothetical protein